MKYAKFIELKKEFSDSPDWGVQLANEMVCGGTGDSRYCDHYIKQSGYTSGRCKLGLDPIQMVDWKCLSHTIIPFPVKHDTPKTRKDTPDISKWFDTTNK